MAVYITLLCGAILPSFFTRINENERRKKTYLVFIFSLIALVSALRSINIGVDTRQFCNAYLEIGYLNWDRALALRYEPGFILLCKLLNLISADFQLLLIVSSGFVAFSTARFILKNSDDIAISSFVFFCMFFAQSMNLMRQYLALGVLLFGINLIKEKKYFKFLLVSLAAMMFHYSAIICLIYFFLYKIKIKKGMLLALSGVMVVILLNFRQIMFLIYQFELFNKYSGYIGGRFDTADSTRWVKMAIALLILIFFLINTKEKEDEKGIKHNFIVNLLLAWAMIETLATNSYIFTRIAPYLDFIAIIAIPKALSSIKEKKIKTVFIIIIYAVMIAYFVVSRMINISRVMPYNFYWEV
ncbi:MAG: EpsG family protein [Oscillospiraceae bacterium]|nr:EpsG family protein [Oscillospiraceae bacterium]